MVATDTKMDGLFRLDTVKSQPKVFQASLLVKQLMSSVLLMSSGIGGWVMPIELA